MKILIACEFSGTVREAFKAKGHDAWSCDLLPTEIPGQHIQGDVLEILGDGWDMMIGHPPCTYLTNAANKWLKDQPPLKSGKLVGEERRLARVKAIQFFVKLAQSSIEKICIENPVGVMSSCFRKADQIIQPYEFGHNHSKQTCVWLKNLPLLKPTQYIEPKIINGKKRWSNQNPSCGSDNTPARDGEDRGKTRSRTFSGIAEAMSNQWNIQ